MSRATVMAGSNRRLRSSAAGAMPGTGSGSSSFRRALRSRACLLQARQLARALHLQKPRLDLFEQVRLCYRPGRAAHTEILRRNRDGNRREDRGKQQSGHAHHRCASAAGSAASSFDTRGGGPSWACGRIVVAPGAGPVSSGPTSGPFRPSQGMSGMAMARPEDAPPRHQADLGIAAVMAVPVIGVQKEMPRRDRAGRDRLERPPVERMRLGAADGPAGQKDRSVLYRPRCACPARPRTVLRYGTGEPTESGGWNSTRSPISGCWPNSGKTA